MANHRTQQVSEAFKNTLDAALTRNVYRAREYGVPDSNLPATFVHLGSEDPGSEEEGATWPVMYSRLELVVVEAAAVAADIEETLIDMRRESTQALRADFTLGLSFVSDLIEGQVEAIEYEAEGSVKAFYRHHWIVQFQRDWDDPTT